ncbi:Retrovirus-related Pol polyprotein from transposon TNT 1-94 [Cucumis melo var. makuwa]|uniref:Retrovirus-related Pol polyprotein from transposon TNT 1-94 n=1 Tax=Cucumis melo var. makuwa TaxID=1194695 RepID=A0A5D3DXG0_CUCMM|nr:Retrovirus-related Pol polyprotein from transposon TNT 1-94 [Cucumis melo var. makuwa]TYK28311.1 Retrovirus-related Pol polyprotein from transposon TNT 1-94 [Cucumis melo var. makuwa]
MMYKHIDFVIAASTPVSLYSHATSIIKFNGLNFFDWCEQIRLHLGVLELDLVLLSEKPAAITSTSSDEGRSFYKAKEFMKSIEKCSQPESADKSLARTLMSTLTNIKFDGSRTIHEHFLEMTNLAARLKTMGMEVNENFLVTFILNSLPLDMLIQEEARLKKPVIHSANVMGHKGAGNKAGKKNGKGNHGQLKKDCLKCKAWFENKDKHNALVWFENKVVDSVNNPQEQQINGQTPHDDVITNEPVTEGPQEIELRRSVRSRRSAISDDYVIYLHESEFDLSIDNDPVSFSQAIKGDNSAKWLDAMKEELKSMNDNEVWDLVELSKEVKELGVNRSLRPNMTQMTISNDTRLGL